MDRSQAQADADRLNSSHPDRERFEWRALQRGVDAWVVVKGPRRRIDPLTATTEAAQKPSQPDDPWSGPLGDLPGYR